MRTKTFFILLFVSSTFIYARHPVHFSVVNLELDKNSRNDEYLYHTISIPTIPNTLLIKKLILPDLFIDQTNLLIFSCGNNEKGLTFDAQKTEQLFDLKNIL